MGSLMGKQCVEAAATEETNVNVTVSQMTDDANALRPSGAMVLFGRFMLADQSEYPCRVVQITPDHADLTSSAEVEEGAQIVAYIDEIGRVEGTAINVGEESFRLQFKLTPLKRERIFKRLEWLRDKAAGKAHDQRRHQRYQPKNSQSVITLPDGRSYPCKVLDISLSGASVETSVLPALGTHIMLGKMYGRVVRYHEQGLGIEFLRPMDQNTLRAQVRDA